MPLNDQQFLPEYETLREDVVRAFYEPAFEESISYKRAVGYFTSRALEILFQGIGPFVARKGKIQLITSPQLVADDIQEIRQGYKARTVIERSLSRAIDEIYEAGGFDQLGLLGCLIANGSLELKIAFTSAGDYLFHSKYGVFKDGEGNRVAFNGSNNETESAIRHNHESFEVFCSWIESDASRVRHHEKKFDDLWNNIPDYCQVIDFPDVPKHKLKALGRQWLESCKMSPSEQQSALLTAITGNQHVFKTPAWFEMRPYQKEAINCWWRNNFQGVFAMATGTGKTLSALSTASYVFQKFLSLEENPGLFILILVPYEYLVRQWASDVRAFGVEPIEVRNSVSKWSEQLGKSVHDLNINARPIAVAIATNDSFARPHFQSLIADVKSPFLFIADEVHNLGAPSYLSQLPAHAQFRLGLSATPERAWDDDGTKSIIEYFGGIVFEYPMEKAIDNGYLTPYYYHPQTVELTDHEAERYLELSNQISRTAAIGSRVSSEDKIKRNEERLLRLSLERSKLVAHAENKTAAFMTNFAKHKYESHQLIYCAEGSHPLAPHEERQTVLINEKLRENFQVESAIYVAETAPNDRAALLEAFDAGEDLQCLVSMRCLDEGVDIPNARIGYILASTTNYRQFVQRRGRLLRKAEGKLHATIYDYLVIPSKDHHEAKIGRTLLKNEIKRAEEFCRLAINEHETSAILTPLKKKYGLLGI